MAATLTYVTPNGVEMTLTGTPAELAQVLMTVPEAPAKAKTASPKRKAAPKEPRKITERSLPDFRRETGTKFRKQLTAARAVYDGKVEAPGWTVGPKTVFYFENGRWPTPKEAKKLS